MEKDCEWKGTPMEEFCRKRINRYLEEFNRAEGTDFKLKDCYFDPFCECVLTFSLEGEDHTLVGIERTPTFEIDEITGRFIALTEALRALYLAVKYKGSDKFRLYQEALMKVQKKGLKTSSEDKIQEGD